MSAHSLTNEVGIGSRLYDLVGEEENVKRITITCTLSVDFMLK